MSCRGNIILNQLFKSKDLFFGKSYFRARTAKPYQLLLLCKNSFMNVFTIMVKPFSTLCHPLPGIQYPDKYKNVILNIPSSTLHCSEAAGNIISFLWSKQLIKYERINEFVYLILHRFFSQAYSECISKGMPTLNPWIWGQSIDCPNLYFEQVVH